MKKIKIAIQGELGAYSHIAANNLFKDAEINTCATFEETFKKAYEDESYKIIIPIENSLAGRVADIHYLLPKYKLQIHGEYFLNVEHNLLCKPDAKINDIKFEQSKNVLISNVTASEISDKNEIKKLLIDQIENRVRWRESVNYMIKNDVNHFVEIGPGKVLSGLVKRINKTVKIDTINNENDIKNLNI